ncbi:Ppx/GppA phosphatase family protein [Limosilactobacillus equigenerosi]|uniref:Ppx/GppA phosphatase family protein n=1 Tax=Limosilactobacillus equigenerosi TaxID=417373 RepID=UPI000AA9E5CC
MSNFVVIDLGSNSVRLRINHLHANGTFYLTHQAKEFVRLSENMGPEKTLKEVPIKRTLAALLKFKMIYEELPDCHVVAVATAAVRQATNQADFLIRVKDEVGLKLRILTGDEEAYLDYLGVSNTLPISKGLIMDTGGASTELIDVKHGKMKHRISIPWGSVNLSQTFKLNDQISASDLFRAMNQVSASFAQVGWINHDIKGPLIVIGGSNRTIAKIRRRQLTTVNSELLELHGMHLPKQEIFDIMAHGLSLNQSQRKKYPRIS